MKKLKQHNTLLFNAASNKKLYERIIFLKAQAVYILVQDKNYLMAKRHCQKLLKLLQEML
jgi:hypothetical protein